MLRDYEVSTEESDGVKLVKRTFAYDYGYDLAPLDVIAHYWGTGDVPTAVSVLRPDGLEIELFRGQISTGDEGAGRHFGRQGQLGSRIRIHP